MLNEGASDYPSAAIAMESMVQPKEAAGQHHQSIQKWIDLVDRCLEQQWKDSQHLLVCAKTLKDASTFYHPSDIIQELSNLGLGIMQRSIDLRQELVDNAYHIGLLNHQPSPFSESVNSIPISQKKKKSTHGGSTYMSLPSSPESDLYEPLLANSSIKPTLLQKEGINDENITRTNIGALQYDEEYLNEKSNGDDDNYDTNDNLDNDEDDEVDGKGVHDVDNVTISGYSPFTLHSKLWQHHRLYQQRQATLSTSSVVSYSSSFSSSSSTRLRHESPKKCSSLLAPSPSAPTISPLLPAQCDDNDKQVDGQNEVDSYITKIHGADYQNICQVNFIPACTYNYYPSNSSALPAASTSALTPIQCRQCFFCRSSMPRQRSLSVEQRTRSFASDDDDDGLANQQAKQSSIKTLPARHPEPSYKLDDGNRSPDNDGGNKCNEEPMNAKGVSETALASDLDCLPLPPLRSSPPPSLVDRVMTDITSPSIAPIPPSLMMTPVTAAEPKATTSTPTLGSQFITPSTPSFSSSMVHTMSTKFHFKRSSRKRSDAELSSSSLMSSSIRISTNSMNSDDTTDKPRNFVRSIINRKVSFPSLFSSKKVHPISSSASTDNQSISQSLLI